MENSEQTNVLKGVLASGGIAIGKAFLFEEEDFCIVPRKIQKAAVKKEIERFKDAISHVKTDLSNTKEQILKTLGKKHEPLVDAYLLMLEDPILNRDVIRKIQDDNVNAEYSLWSTLEKVTQSFEKIDDEYFRERKNDVQEIGRRIMRNLTGQHRKHISEAPPDSIIIAHSLAPADTMMLKEHKISGFAINVGGRTSHVAIVAQGLEIPAVVGLKNITAVVNYGDTIIIDGNQGLVIVNPDQQTLENYQRECEIQIRERKELEKLRDLPAETTDGHRVSLACNIETLDELKSVLNSGAEGIGLFRTEFLYLTRKSPPTEEEHYEIYTAVAQKMLPYSVIIRTMDIGGDKLAELGFEGFTSEDNPFLGMRAIRLSLKYPELFKAQIRAILRASKNGNLKILFPMISGVDELRQAKRLMQESKQELMSKNIAFDEKIEIGVMIEIPSAALTADLIAKECDFLSIGTNDLIQYTLAVDRMNESVAHMYEPLHLSILRLLKHIIDAGHNAGKWVGMCGEMASDPTFTTILLGMELNEFSMPPLSVPRIKKIIRSTSLIEAKDLAREVLSTNDRAILLGTIKKGVIV